MSTLAISNQRLHNQHLLGLETKPTDVLSALTAVQSQDFTGAKWALGQRTKESTDEDITKLFNDGKILRTHIMRPTWHFVAPEDIRWMQELTAPRVHAFNKYYYKKLELDNETFEKANKALIKALTGGEFLTRDQVNTVYKEANIDAHGLRLAYLIMQDELDALICSGPVQGKQHTYALLSERAPQAKSLPREEALAKLTKRYFAGHGPAQVQDFAWWSGLTISDVKQGIELAKLDQVSVEGKTYFFTEQSSEKIDSPVVHLLPNYDEYVIAYKDRGAYSNAKFSKPPTYEDLSYHFVMLDGQLAGGWKRDIQKNKMVVTLNLFMKFNDEQNKALDKAIKHLSLFMAMPVEIV